MTLLNRPLISTSARSKRGEEGKWGGERVRRGKERDEERKKQRRGRKGREERERLNCILYINQLRHNIKEYFTVQM